MGKEAAIEAEVKAARERAVIPLEIRMKQFRDMLAEKEVCYKHVALLSLKDVFVKFRATVPPYKSQFNGAVTLKDFSYI